ncbi:hypothetical protein GCM10023321_01880 [Pseudonocardia eucalypti]|uniref:Uncharacterized protein n=2 Tax=Pseudonocardia eucalypti TaxID=648755 RepID=A0ABP9PDJ9_9PSEU
MATNRFRLRGSRPLATIGGITWCALAHMPWGAGRMSDRDRVSDPALDAELARRTEQEARIAAALVELDGHPGRALLTAGPLSGETARRWSDASPRYDALWRDFERLRAVLTEARELRDRRGPRAMVDLLFGRCIEPDPAEPAALPDRLRSAGAAVERIDLQHLVSRIDEAFHQVSTIVVEVDRVRGEFLAEYAPLVERLRAARALADELGLDPADPAVTDAAALAERAHQLDASASADPLGSPHTGRLAELAPALGTLETWLAGLARHRDNWAASVTEVTEGLRRADSLLASVDEAHRRGREVIANPHLAPVPDRLPALRIELDRLATVNGWSARADAMDRLRARLRAAAEELREALRLAEELVDRRAELRGRYEAYRAKASRLGRGEQPEVLELDRRLRQLLWSRPCDLAAATRALVEYQRLVTTPVGSR